MSTRGDIRKIIRDAKRRGWVDVTDNKTRGHTRLKWTTGATVSIAITPSDHHAAANIKADLRRAERLGIDKSKT